MDISRIYVTENAVMKGASEEGFLVRGMSTYTSTKTGEELVSIEVIANGLDSQRVTIPKKKVSDRDIEDLESAIEKIKGLDLATYPRVQFDSFSGKISSYQGKTYVKVSAEGFSIIDNVYLG